MQRSPRPFEEIVKGHTPQVARLARSLRRLVRTAVPTLREEIMPGYARYWNQHTMVAAITVHRDHVNLQFFFGTDLTDPEGLLVGMGKRLRHVALHAQADLRPPYLSRLVRQAARHAKPTRSG